MHGLILTLIGTHLFQVAKSCSLIHNGYCLQEYTVISGIALTEDSPLYCALDGGGHWIGPDGTPCGESGSGPFNCNNSQTSDHSTITLYKRPSASFSGKQLYTCTGTGQNISMQIENNTVLSAIYIDPPADVRSIPQSYTIHCITTGRSDSDITVGIFLERHGRSYYDQIVPPVLGFNETPPNMSTLNSTTNTYDYYETVVWRADKVEVDETEFNDHGFTKYNADHDWACGVISNTGYDDLQTYIRAPNFVPTNLTVQSRNSTSVTISWTAVNATDADGYIIYIDHQYSDAHSAVTVGNTTQYTLWYHQSLPLYGYNITVRAHQDLLGPPSEPLVISTTNLTLTSLTCIITNSDTIAVALSTPHSLPRKGLSYRVRYYRCDSASLEENFITSEKNIVVRNLGPNTCYEFTIIPMFAKHIDSEGRSIRCSTLQNPNNDNVSIGILTTLTIAGIISAFALLITVVVLVVKRIQRQQAPCLERTQRRLCDMRTNMAYSEEGYVNDDFPAEDNDNPYKDFVEYEEVQN